MSHSFLSSTQHCLLPYFTLPITRRHVYSAATLLPLSSIRVAFPRSDLLLLCCGSTPFCSLRVSLALQRFRVCAGVGFLLQDAGATTAVLAGAYGLVLGFDSLTKRKLIQQNLSSKLVHILSGLLFMVSWPIFRELLRGPLFYVLTLLLSAVVFWCESPIGVISLSMMCGGNGSVCLFPTLFSPMPLDYFSLVQQLIGVANIIGRRFGSVKIFYIKKKIWAGSISMFVFGFLVSIGCVQLYGF